MYINIFHFWFRRLYWTFEDDYKVSLSLSLYYVDWEMTLSGDPRIALWSGNMGWQRALSHLVHGMKQRKSNSLFLCRQLSIKSSTSYFVVPLETCPRFIEVLATKRVYQYINKSRYAQSHTAKTNKDMRHENLLRAKSSCIMNWFKKCL